MSPGRAWVSRSLGSKAQHEFFYACIRLGGWRLAYAALVVVVLFYTLRPGIRSRSRPYLSRRFPSADPIGMFLHAFRLNLEFGKVLVDRAARGIAGMGRVDAAPQDRELFRTLLSRNRGLIVLTAHAGAWQWAMSGLDFLDRRMNVLYLRDPGDVDRQYFEHSWPGITPRFIDPRSDFGGVIEIMAALKAGEAVCAMGDRVLGGTGNAVRVSFLGDDISLPLGMFVIAAKLGTPVALVFAPRTGPCRARIQVARVWEETLDADPAEMVRQFGRSLEDFVRQAPYQFFNFYDLWSEPTS